ncbi:hypothetical protein FQN57_000433 [Myotisia sp. PD_48]|nr:hypothetical protein FQN57_000433 [Myotisia sp. PD_48]
MGEFSTATMIKTEPDDMGSNPHQFMVAHSGYGMSNPSYGNQFGNSGPNESIDPSELTMQHNGFLSHPFSSQNLSSSYTLGNSGIDTEELLDLEIPGQNGLTRDDSMNMLGDQNQPTGISMGHQGQMSHIYSSTPEGAPIQSPFLRGTYNYDQFRAQQHTPQATSPHMNSMGIHFDQGFIGNKARGNFSSDRTPMTPKTPALGGLNIGTPDSGSFPSQPIRAPSLSHAKSMSGQWNGTPGSAHSLMESPISSPGHPHHIGISEILKSGKHASLPAKVDSLHGHHPTSAQSLESQEAKRRRRRASHNLVERRRRDNINERIQDLSHLVPQHRLDDEKVRKQLVNNSSLSTSVGATGISPTNAATSLLAGGNGRRATAGNITMGLPLDEKEKGPNKGDILNGSVGWTRDLMWALYRKLEQEDQLAEYIGSLGGSWPFEQTEEDKRMRTEIMDAVEKNDPVSFSYSRGVGSGLRVPKHTNISGEPLLHAGMETSPPGLSPGFHSASNSAGGQAQFWGGSGPAGMSFKEEDNYSIDMS